MRKRQLNYIVSITIGIATSFFLDCNKNEMENVSAKTIEPPENKTQVNWIGHWLHEGDKVILVREIANEYEFLNQDINVNLKFPEEIYGGDGKPEIDFLVAQIKKPTPDWDIIRLYGNFSEIGKLLDDPNWTDKYLVDFSQVPGFIESHKPFINNVYYKRRFENKFFGPYNECQIAALFVNLEVAKKMGITVKQFDMTFDDFLGYIQAAYKYNQSHPNVIPVFEYDWSLTTMTFQILFFSLMDNFDQVLDTKLTPKKLDAIEKCYQAFEQLSRFNPIEKNWEQHKWINENDFILKDSCLFFPCYTYMYTIWKQKASEKMNKVIPCEFPVFKPSSAYIGGYLSNWAVLKNSPHLDEAIKLLMYWCKSEVAEKWVRCSKSPSGVIGNLATSSFGVDPFESYSYIIEKKYGSNLLNRDDIEYIFGENNKDVPLRVQDVLEGKLTAKDAFDEFKKKVVY